jgi:hypothetical protein
MQDFYRNEIALNQMPPLVVSIYSYASFYDAGLSN